ncbi:MAG: thymidine phosphorylase [Eubacterium sp.]
MGQTGNLAPADKLLYALRDVTATVESIPLIAASIMSKKLAAGSDKIVLDVTTGSGAFIKDLKDSRELAKRMVAIGNGAGKETVAVITSMDEPLGQAVGNNLEVKEAMEVLQNRGPADVREVATALAGMMISLGRDTTYECGKMLAEEALNKGRAWEKFKTMVENQGGDLSYIEDPDRFDVAAFSREIRAPKAGYITSMQTEQIGVAAGVLGAGREKKDSKVDYSAGILVYKKIGAYVEPGDVMAVLYTNREESLDTAGELYLESVQIDEVKPELPQLIVDIIR